MNAPSCATGCGRPSPSTGLCRTCLDTLLTDLRAAKELGDELTITLIRGARSGTRVGGRSSVTPLPWHEGAADAATALRDTMSGWAYRLHLLHGVRVPVPTPADPAGSVLLPPDFIAEIGSVAAWLLRHPSWMATHPQADGLYSDITAVVAHAWKVIDLVPDRWYAGPCHEPCRGQVFGEPGGKTAVCLVCRTTYDMASRRDYLFGMARKYAMTAAELSRAMPVLLGMPIHRKTITTWARRGDLVAADYDDRRGWPLYLMGDVEALALRRLTG